MSKLVLYLSYDGMTDQLGQSQVLPYLCGLSKKGYDIHLISFEKRKKYQSSKNVIQKIVDEHHITWHTLRYHKFPPVLSSIYDISKLKSMAAALHKDYNFQIVHCRSYITAFAGLWMKKKFGTKFIFDMRGFYADERVDGKIWNKANPVYSIVYNYFKKKEKQFLTGADHIVSLTQNAKAIILNWQLTPQALPVSVVPCCADLNLFDYHNFTPQFVAEKKSSMGYSGNDKILVYLGAIGTWYMLPQMLQFFERLHNVDPDYNFLFVTNESSDSIFSVAAKTGLKKETIKVVAAARTEVPQLLSICNYAVFFILPTFSKQASSPTKQGELMGMGIPIICNVGVGDTDMIITKTDAGILVRAFTSSDYDSAIESMKNKTFTREKIRQGAFEFYSLQKGVSEYEKIYNHLSP